jgi:hypothetical protein
MSIKLQPTLVGLARVRPSFRACKLRHKFIAPGHNFIINDYHAPLG